MELPDVETHRLARGHSRRPLVVAVVLAFATLGLVGVTAPAFLGSDTHRIVSTTAGQRTAGSTAQPSNTTTTVKPVVTTTVTVATTVASTAPPSTARYSPPATPTTRLVTTPPTTATPRTTTTTVARTASLRMAPSVAQFPALPPPYWPMPIVSVTITNNGGVAVRGIVVHPVGVYSIPSSTCATLMPGQSCVAEVQFCPTSPNHYLDTLLVTGQDAITGSPLRASITLNGTAT